MNDVIFIHKLCLAYLEPDEGACYIDDVNDRIMSEDFERINEMSPRDCILLCKNKGFKYAGTENASECFCSNTPPPLKFKTSKEECNMKCNGYTEEMCGGKNRLNLYRTHCKFWHNHENYMI